MDANNVKMIVTIPSGGYGDRAQNKICLGLGWLDELEPTHRVMVSRTSSCPLIHGEEAFISKNKIPIQSLGGLLQKISEAVIDSELIVDFCNDEELGDYIYIEVYDDYRE